jgi:hypothetical protein
VDRIALARIVRRLAMNATGNAKSFRMSMSIAASAPRLAGRAKQLAATWWLNKNISLDLKGVRLINKPNSFLG